MYAVIMAGGGGTRLHPLSRPERPKPFLPLLGDRSLLQATAARLRPTDDVTVVTDRRYEGQVREQLPDADVLVEPIGRNTAAAIALAALAVDRATTTTSCSWCRPIRSIRRGTPSATCSGRRRTMSRRAHSASTVRS